jgi:type IV fimbrial biogenesis protein FimT
MDFVKIKAAVRPVARSGGFTLIELMVTVAIFGVFFAFALPGMRTWAANRQVSLLAETIASGLREAQIGAISRPATVQAVMTTSAVAPPPANPSTVTLSAGGLAKTDPAINLMVRVQGATTAAGVLMSQGAAQGWTNARVTGLAGATNVAGVTFSALGRVTNTVDAAGVATPLTGNGVIVFQVLNADLPSSATRRRCVVLSAGGAARVCDPTITTGDSRSCQPQITAAQCPGS